MYFFCCIVKFSYDGFPTISTGGDKSNFTCSISRSHVIPTNPMKTSFMLRRHIILDNLFILIHCILFTEYEETVLIPLPPSGYPSQIFLIVVYFSALHLIRIWFPWLGCIFCVFLVWFDLGETGESKLGLHQHGGEVVPGPFAPHIT